MTMAYIRRMYRVPAERGGRVTYRRSSGVVWTGTIIGTEDAYIRVRWDGDGKPDSNVHPTDINLTYGDPA